MVASKLVSFDVQLGIEVQFLARSVIVLMSTNMPECNRWKHLAVDIDFFDEIPVRAESRHWITFVVLATVIDSCE